MNPQRGDVSAVLDGETRVLRLTLGSLAELEAALDVPDLLSLAERFETGSLSAREITAVIAAGLRGAGADVSDADVARMSIEGGAAGAMRLVASLLAAAFGP